VGEGRFEFEILLLTAQEMAEIALPQLPSELINTIFKLLAKDDLLSVHYLAQVSKLHAEAIRRHVANVFGMSILSGYINLINPKPNSAAEQEVGDEGLSDSDEEADSQEEGSDENESNSESDCGSDIERKTQKEKLKKKKKKPTVPVGPRCCGFCYHLSKAWSDLACYQLNYFRSYDSLVYKNYCDAFMVPVSRVR